MLNKKDMLIYEGFLDSICSYPSEMTSHIFDLAHFIENNYNSNETELFDLDDFISEATMRIYCGDYDFNKLYSEMRKNEDYKYNKNIDSDKEVDEIDYRGIYFDMFYPEFHGNCTCGHCDEIIDLFKEGYNQKETGKRIGVVPQRVSFLKNMIRRNLYRNDSIRDYYEDILFPSYHYFLLNDGARSAKMRKIMQNYFFDKNELSYEEAKELLATLKYLRNVYNWTAYHKYISHLDKDIMKLERKLG